MTAQESTARLAPGIEALLGRMTAMLEPLVAAGDPRRYFLATYQRTTRAVGEAIDEGLFEDGPWVEAWDIAFADLYLDAVGVRRPAGVHGGSRSPPTPTCRRCATSCSASTRTSTTTSRRRCSPSSPTRRSTTTSLMARRRADHERIDEVLSARVTAEDDALAAAGPRRYRPVAHAAQPGRHQAAAARGAAEGLGQHRHPVVRAPRPTRRRTRDGSPTSRRSAPNGSPTCMLPGQVLLRLARPRVRRPARPARPDAPIRPGGPRYGRTRRVGVLLPARVA